MKEQKELSKRFANQRLKHQIEGMEEQLEETQAVESSIPYVIPSARVFMNHLSLIKRWISQKRCIIIVTMSGNPIHCTFIHYLSSS